MDYNLIAFLIILKRPLAASYLYVYTRGSSRAALGRFYEIVYLIIFGKSVEETINIY